MTIRQFIISSNNELIALKPSWYSEAYSASDPLIPQYAPRPSSKSPQLRDTYSTTHAWHKFSSEWWCRSHIWNKYFNETCFKCPWEICASLLKHPITRRRGSNRANLSKSAEWIIAYGTVYLWGSGHTFKGLRSVALLPIHLLSCGDDIFLWLRSQEPLWEILHWK